MNEQQHDIDDFEKQTIDELKNRKTIDLTNATFKQRVYSRIASFVGRMLLNFGTKLNYQFALIAYLGIVCPIGTYTFIKWIVNLF